MRVRNTNAKRVGRELWNRHDDVISIQVFQEFYVNVTRKIAKPLAKASARMVVESYTVWCIDTAPAEISVAFRIEDDAGIGFWDALIVAAARKAGAARIFVGRSESRPDHRRSEDR